MKQINKNKTKMRTKTMCENKENKDVKHVNLEGESEMGKNVVTNEKIMKHLEEIELANACILMGITNIFQFILKRKEKYNVKKYEEMAFASGIEAMQDQSERMLNMVIPVSKDFD